MADFTDTLTDDHIAMLAKQPVFFVATAAPDARINLSPKGYDALRVLAPDRVAYLDLAGSGNETNAHLLADGRITIMVCNFEQPALILRIYGTGTPVLPGDEKWDALAEHFELLPGTRQIFDIAVESVQTSCGWGVPFMDFEAERATLKKYHAQAQPEKWVAKQQARGTSIDGLPTRATDTYIAGTTASPDS
ncbi:MAG: pyridoxamine 5'-phosphate oxidase family protein [Alteraurantiacibacter sp.]